MMVMIFIPDVPEFLPLVNAAKILSGCVVTAPHSGYWRITGEKELRFQRKPMGLGPAIWNSALSGGFRGRIIEYGKDSMILRSED